MRLVVRGTIAATLLVALAIGAFVAWSRESKPAGPQVFHVPLSATKSQISLGLPELNATRVDRLVRNVEHLELASSPTKRLPSIDQLPDLKDLPPVCTSELEGLDLNAPLPMSQPTMPIPNELPLLQNARQEFSSYAAPYGGNAAMLNPHAKATAENLRVKQESPETKDGPDPHAAAFSKSCYPSANECRACHKQIYDEWAISSHANAAISPMFHKFEQKINSLAQGTLGYFCMRCHAPVATTEKHPRWESIFDGPRVWREGVTCVACHRVTEAYAKTNGERRMEPGQLDAPVVGSGSGEGLAKVLQNPEQYKVKLDPNDKRPGQVIHNRVIQFAEISNSTFCLTCHQVAVQPGIKLEVVWEQYRHSPAFRQGIRCHDCHMGKEPGVAHGFCTGPTAVVNNIPVSPNRRHSNHTFFGPGYSVAHPGIFPHNPEADRWTPAQWLKFDWRAGWGTEKFEEKVESGVLRVDFPPEWAEMDDRLDAREVLDANFKALAVKDELRRKVMEAGSKVDGPFFAANTQRPDGSIYAGKDLSLHYLVTNLNIGHNMPTASLGAQPQLWLNVVLIAPSGKKVWETGYLDSAGDLADIHSIDVHQGKVPFDRQLFNLQTKFLITNVKGTDREIPLPVNIDIDQLPFIRPAPQPVTVLNHPPFIRMEGHSLAPLGSRKAPYKIPACNLTEPGMYRLSIRMRNRAEPIYFMKFVESTPEMIRSMNEKILDVHPYTVAFEVR